MHFVIQCLIFFTLDGLDFTIAILGLKVAVKIILSLPKHALQGDPEK